AHALAGRGFVLADCGQWASHGEVVAACNQQLFGWEACDHLVTRFGDNDFFFDAGCAPAIGRGPEGLESEHHAGLDYGWMFERNQAADHRLLPDGKADSVAVLQSETCFLVGEAEFLRLGPHGGDFSGCAAWTHELNRGIEIFPAALI